MRHILQITSSINDCLVYNGLAPNFRFLGLDLINAGTSVERGGIALSTHLSLSVQLLEERRDLGLMR